MEMDAKPVAARWVGCLSRMRDTLETAVEYGPDSDVAARLAGYADELGELALEFESSAKVWESLAGVNDEHRGVLSDHDSLNSYVRVLDEGPSTDVLPQNAGGLVEELDRHLHSLAHIADDLRDRSVAMGEANAEKRSRLIEEMAALRKRETATLSDTERLLAKLFPGIESHVDNRDAGGGGGCPCDHRRGLRIANIQGCAPRGREKRGAVCEPGDCFDRAGD